MVIPIDMLFGTLVTVVTTTSAYCAICPWMYGAIVPSISALEMSRFFAFDAARFVAYPKQATCSVDGPLAAI